ncbi:hypothetical protein T484DRAFT_1632246 [Baffinella frigidus]|nr:hypothetical protein T484DRAFT_1632246 [Cryptophyta sp. CCMP2293]
MRVCPRRPSTVFSHRGSRVSEDVAPEGGRPGRRGGGPEVVEERGLGEKQRRLCVGAAFSEQEAGIPVWRRRPGCEGILQNPLRGEGVGGCGRVWEGVGESARVHEEVVGCARVCQGLRGCARECEGVSGRAILCEGMCEGVCEGACEGACDGVWEFGSGVRGDGLGCRVWGSGVRGEGLGCRVEGSGVRGDGLGCRV